MLKAFRTLGFLIIVLLSVNLQACSSVQQMIQGTPTFTPTVTLTPSPTFTVTSTSRPTKTPTPTITPNLAATQQYLEFTSFIQKAYDAGQISTTEGRYKQVNDFSDELAMNYGYRWLPTGVKAKNFIVRAEFNWEVANLKNFSGCGYIFRQISQDYYYLVALDASNGTLLTYASTGADGLGNLSLIHTSLLPVKKNQLPDMGSNPYQATFTLIVNEGNAYTYINNNFFTEYRLKSDTVDWSGDLASMVLTGSETDFGTRCEITNAEAWIISP